MTRPRKASLKNRSTGELLIIMIAGTVCLVVLASTVAVMIAEFVNPDQDTSGAASQVGDIINTLIGLLAGFLAARTEYSYKSQSPEEVQSGVESPVESDSE